MRPSPTSEITVPRPRFDRAAPVPDRMTHAALATGVGQAPTTRLLSTMLGAAAGAVLVLLLAPAWWVVATPPLMLAALCGWGLATKRLLILRLSLRAVPVARVVLEVLRALMVLLGLLAAVAGIGGIVRLLLSPWRM